LRGGALLEKAMTKTFLLAVLVAGLAVAPAQADTTIGADDNSATNYTGACNGGGGPAGTPANRPCTVVNLTTAPARTMQAPCDGTVTRYRLNGIVTANTYRIRAVTNNGNATYTPTATSSPPVSIQTAGVNEYPSSMPIKQGQYVGIDFMNDIVGGLKGYSGGPGSGVFEAVLYAFPADGGTGTDTPSPDYDNYLYNADVACSVAAPTTTKCKKKKNKKNRDASVAKKKRCKKKHQK
jgi:hypothetical protein